MAEALITVTLCWSLQPRRVHEHALLVPANSTVDAVLNLAMAQLGPLPNTGMTPTRSILLKTSRRGTSFAPISPSTSSVTASWRSRP